MDYVQMTLDDWMSLKQEIAEEFARASASFVRIGYLLRKAEESEGYKNDGYDTLTEWAQAELGITGTYVSRFKAINARYSVGGYSDRLQDRYVGYGSAKLGEMLALPDADMEMVTPQTKREDIRTLKQFNREAPTAEGADWVTDMMHVCHADVLEEIVKQHALGLLTGKKCAEILNPGGSRMVRTKAAVIAMKDDGLIVKTFGPGGGRQEVSWQEAAGKIARRIEAGKIKARPAAGTGAEDTGAATAQRPEGKTLTESSAEEAAGPGAEDTGPAEGAVKETAPAEGGTEEASAEGAPKKAKKKKKAEQQEEKAEQEEPSPAKAGPSVPDERMGEYIQALSDVRGKLEEIEKSFQEGDWHRMSDQLLALGFIVNQLKVMETI